MTIADAHTTHRNIFYGIEILGRKKQEKWLVNIICCRIITFNIEILVSLWHYMEINIGIWSLGYKTRGCPGLSNVAHVYIQQPSTN